MSEIAQIRNLKEKSVDRLLCAEVLDKQAFVELADLLKEEAKKHINETHVPRYLLQTTLQAINALETRADYLPELKNEYDLSPRFESIFNCLCSGEDPGARQPGVPRII